MSLNCYPVERLKIIIGVKFLDYGESNDSS